MSRSFRNRSGPTAPLGSWLLGSPDEGPERQRLRMRLLLTGLLAMTNLIGAAVVVVLVIVVIPGPDLRSDEYHTIDYIVVPVYILAAFAVGTAVGTATALRALEWATDGREPSPKERRAALALPWRLTLIQGSLWAGAFVVFTVAAAAINVDAVPKVAFTIALGGITVAAFSYVFSEFALRAVAAQALDAGPDLRRVRLTRVSDRTMLAWFLGSGVPVIGLILIAAFSFVRPSSAVDLAVAILALGSITLVFGFALSWLGARQITDPLRSVIDAMAEIERGEPPGEVVVYDGSELGELQSGFNRMSDGLRERERIRDLFGRQVGLEVAEAALARNPELGGEERHVAIFFIDIVGSTALAASRPPQHVVDLLNRFFDVVVSEVDRCGGIINKFEGDAALAVFGAPVDADDPAGRALAAARAVCARLPGEVPDCDAATGVAYGLVVAGNIGARNRFEYTVIGDAVNEAARLCELAKQYPCRMLASQRAVDAADPDEARHWESGDEVTLRGRREPTRLAVPRARRPDR